MESGFITLTIENIDAEHICCAITSKETKEGYELKKRWLKQEIEQGYVFCRLNERAKVFIEYVAAEKAWVPVNAPNYLMINCFWVSGKYKKQGYGKALLQKAIDSAREQKKEGLVTVVGTKKFHFMSDTQWLLHQGFKEVQQLPNGFSLLVYKLNLEAKDPTFNPNTLTGTSPYTKGLAVYYSNRCPFTEHYVQTALREMAQKKHIPLYIIKLTTLEEAKNAPTPATIFSLFYNGQFITTDISICTEKRFNKWFETIE